MQVAKWKNVDNISQKTNSFLHLTSLLVQHTFLCEWVRHDF